MYVVFDLETTSLLSLEAAGQEAQPEIIECAAIKLAVGKAELHPVDTLQFKCLPKGKMHPSAEKVHGISLEMLANEKPFVAYYRQLAEFFIGTKYWVGHNCMFDKQVLQWELQRIGKSLNFSWPPYDICTMSLMEQQRGYRLSLTNAYAELLGETFADAHTAMSDCQATARLFMRMWEQKMIGE